MKVKLDELVLYLMSKIVEGHIDEETGELCPTEEACATWTTQKHGDFEIIVRRPQKEDGE